MNTFKERYGDWAVISGATSGIGEELAKQVAEKGFNVVMIARRKELLELKSEEIAKKFDVKVRVIQADLSKPDGIKEVIDGTKDLEIGLFIPAAGVENHGLISKIDIEKELALIQLNITSVYALTHHYVSMMIKRKRGGILLLASMIGHMPNPYFSNYASSKSYIINLGTSLNGELSELGVDVTVLSPGATETPMMANTGIDMDKVPMSAQKADYVAKVGLDALEAKKPLVIPGFKNNMMVFMATKMSSTKMAIKMGASMMRKALDKKHL